MHGFCYTFQVRSPLKADTNTWNTDNGKQLLFQRRSNQIRKKCDRDLEGMRAQKGELKNSSASIGKSNSGFPSAPTIRRMDLPRPSGEWTRWYLAHNRPSWTVVSIHWNRNLLSQWSPLQQASPLFVSRHFRMGGIGSSNGSRFLRGRRIVARKWSGWG